MKNNQMKHTTCELIFLKYFLKRRIFYKLQFFIECFINYNFYNVTGEKVYSSLRKNRMKPLPNTNFSSHYF